MGAGEGKIDGTRLNESRTFDLPFLLQAVDPNEWCPNNNLLSGGLNPRPLGRESSALTTGLRQLALEQKFLIFYSLPNGSTFLSIKCKKSLISNMC